MKKILYFLFLCLIVACNRQTSTPKEEKTENTTVVVPESSYVQYVTPLMGTDSKFSLSNGNTYPAIAVPWGMHFWTPQTNKMGDGWAYQYHADKIVGFKQTHQPSPWINDYGAFALMPVVGNPKLKEEERASWFSHKAETAKPHYYKVYLADYDTSVEITPTSRAAQFRITFPETDKAYLLLDAYFKGSMVKVLPKERKIIGYTRNNNGGVPDNFHNYFVLTFDKDFETVQTWSDGFKLKNTPESKGEHTGAVIGFRTKKNEQVTVKVASSFISPEQAERNLQTEIGGDTFEQTQQKALTLWETELSKIRVEDDNTDHLRTFYSCLYRTLLFPRTFYEFNNAGEMIHYSPYNGKIEKGYMFTDNGFWDTFRAVFPLFNLLYPEMNQQFMKGLVNAYKESGWLPEWASPGHRDCMIGSNSASIIADAYLKGNIKEGDDAEILLEAMLKSATQNEGRPVKSVGREGVDYYNTLGYIPYNVGINENVARTLEYAYADYCIARMAEQMGKKEIAEKYYAQSQRYKNVFDPETKWMRGKNKNGQFQSPFNPLKWGDAFTEGNSLHYTWSVFQDIEGLIQLMGGKEAFEKKIDEVFEMPPLFDDSYYGFTIHEIREMQIMDMGNYAHGNQPIQHLIYLYNYAGKPQKAQAKLREVMEKLYTPTPDGYCGDEDNGQTSAWYVFSALGFYPVTPASDVFVLGNPLFKTVSLQLPEGKKFLIKSVERNTANPLVDYVQLNGKRLESFELPFKVFKENGTLTFFR